MDVLCIHTCLYNVRFYGASSMYLCEKKLLEQEGQEDERDILNIYLTSDNSFILFRTQCLKLMSQTKESQYSHLCKPILV